MAKPEKQKGKPPKNAAKRKPKNLKHKPAHNGMPGPGPAVAGPAPGPSRRQEMLPFREDGSPAVLDRLWEVVMSRRTADPAVSHSARLLARGVAKVAQKFGEEAVECLIEAVAHNRPALIGESADVLYHLLVLWVAAGVRPTEVWQELERREGMSGVAEKASRARKLPLAYGLSTSKIP